MGKEIKYYYTYLVIPTNKKSSMYGKIYFGKHITKNINDGYIGSGKMIRRYINKYPDDYYREILNYYNSKEELDKAEYELIQPHLGKDYCLNLKCGGTGGDTYLLKTEEELNVIKNKISISCTGRTYSLSETTKEKMSQSRKEYYKTHDSAFKNKHHSEETRKKISESLLGEKHPRYRKNLSDEHKLNLSKNHANVKGCNNPMYGRRKIWDNEEHTEWHWIKI